MIHSVFCPHPGCGRKYKVDESQIGRTTVCKACGRSFMLAPSDRETLPPTESATGPPASPAPVADVSGALPQHLGRFEVRARLGFGAFGAVYRAHDPVLDREVALKVPRAAALAKPEARARFLREPKAAAQLRHPHIVPVYDAGTDGEQYYIASAYIEGRTLEELIADERLDFRRAAQIIRDLADALAYAHAMGVVHRDVKPANIMIDERGQALLMDFGLARLEGAEDKLTQDGSVMGTPAYMAPEQADRKLGEVGPAADQYSLGVVLYELLCGQAPFSGPLSVVIFNVANQEPEPPRHVNPQVPRDLETICLKAMAKEPAARYADCRELGEDLRRWQADEPIRARRMGIIERAARSARRRPVAATLAVALALVTLFGLAAVSSQWRRAEAHRAVAEANLTVARTEQQRAEHNLAEANRQRNAAEEQRKRAEEAQRQLRAALQKAEKSLAEAERQRIAAGAARTAEEQERAKAAQAQQKSQEDAAEAEKQRKLAEDRRLALAWRKYLSDIRLANEAIDAANPEVAQRLLEPYSEVQGEDYRSFDWYYLAHKCGLFRTAASGKPVTVLGGGPKAPRAFAGGGVAFLRDDTLIIRDGGYQGNTGELMGGGSAFQVWGPANGDVLAEGCARGIASAFSADFTKMLCLAQEQPGDGLQAETWDVRSAQAQTTVSLGIGTTLRGTHDFAILRASADCRLLAVAEKTFRPPAPARTPWTEPEMALAVYDLSAQRRLWTRSGWFEDAVFSPDAKTLAVSTRPPWTHNVREATFKAEEPAIELWETETGKTRLRFSVGVAVSDFLDFSADGKTLLDAKLMLWDVAAGRFRGSPRLGSRKYSKRGGGVSSPFVLSRDGKVFAVGEADFEDKEGPYGIQLCDVEKADVLWTAAGHRQSVTCFAFSPDGKVLASGGRDRVVKVWDMRTGEERLTLEGNTGGIVSVAFSPDGLALACGSSKGTIWVWRGCREDEKATKE